MTHLRTGKAIEPLREYAVAGWASVNEGTQGPNIWDVVEHHIASEKSVRLVPNRSVKISGG
jgi:sulfur-oxidizing protein SoxB